MAQVYGAGGKTHPKRGKNGTGSYYPGGTPYFLHKGNTFPGIKVEKNDFDQLTFGDPSRAGIGTQRGENRVRTKALHPNLGHYDNATIPLAPAMVVGSSNDYTNLQPVAPSRVSLSMPHERNTNSAGGLKKKPRTYRTVFGASKMPTDTAFEHKPGAMYKRRKYDTPKSAKEAVKVSVDARSFAQPKAPILMHINKRTPPPSFVSHGQQWMDPHNSFVAGYSTLVGGQGTGRWGIVKKGVV